MENGTRRMKRDIGRYSHRTKQNEGNGKMRQAFPLGKKAMYLKKKKRGKRLLGLLVNYMSIIKAMQTMTIDLIKNCDMLVSGKWEERKGVKGRNPYHVTQ